MKKNTNNEAQFNEAAAPKKQKKQKKGGGWFGRLVRRFFLLLFTVIILLAAALVLVMNMIFNGPSPAAQEVLTMALIEASATKWVPALFIGEERVAEIQTTVNAPLQEEVSDVSSIVINKGSALTATTDEWKNDPDGIRIEHVPGDNYNAHIMIVRDPSLVYMGTSTEKYSSAIPGKRINHAIEDEGAIAAINAGAFFDNGTSDPSVGATPLGLVMSNGKCVWTSGKQPGLEGFAGFNEDNILVVSRTNLSQSQAEEMNIRDGCCFGPALLINGEVNMEAYNNNSGWNPRTAIGQRADGAVIFVCADGRQVSSPGASYADIIDIMVEYGAVNACNMDGGSSSIMMYRDVHGKFGEAGTVDFVNSPSLIQKEPRKMPNFWMVRPAQ